MCDIATEPIAKLGQLRRRVGEGGEDRVPHLGGQPRSNSILVEGVTDLAGGGEPVGCAVANQRRDQMAGSLLRDRTTIEVEHNPDRRPATVPRSPGLPGRYLITTARNHVLATEVAPTFACRRRD